MEICWFSIVMLVITRGYGWLRFASLNPMELSPAVLFHITSQGHELFPAQHSISWGGDIIGTSQVCVFGYDQVQQTHMWNMEWWNNGMCHQKGMTYDDVWSLCNDIKWVKYDEVQHLPGRQSYPQMFAPWPYLKFKPKLRAVSAAARALIRSNLAFVSCHPVGTVRSSILGQKNPGTLC